MKSWPCVYECGTPVSELGAYVKVSSTKYAHLNCHCDRVAERAIAAYRKDVDEFKAQEALAAAEKILQAQQSVFHALPRCARCGAKMRVANDGNDYRALGEVRLPSSTPGVCQTCVQEEIQARARARNVPPPASAAQAIQRAPSAPVAPAEEKKEPEKKSDRFELIDLE